MWQKLEDVVTNLRNNLWKKKSSFSFVQISNIIIVDFEVRGDGAFIK